MTLLHKACFVLSCYCVCACFPAPPLPACVCFRARCVFHSCSCTECVHFDGLLQQFTSHHANLSASSWASASTNSNPAGLTHYPCRVSTDTHAVKRQTGQEINIYYFIINFLSQNGDRCFKIPVYCLAFILYLSVVSVKYWVPGRVRQSQWPSAVVFTMQNILLHLTFHL